jgi:hypothetical protein
LRARLNLSNGDFLEVVEFFKIKGDKCIIDIKVFFHSPDEFSCKNQTE